MTPTFLLCLPYSGATLLSILFDQHRLLSCDGEIFSFRQAEGNCSCGVPQLECPYYREIAGHMLDGAGWGANFARLPRYSRRRLVQQALTPSVHRRLPWKIARSLIAANPLWRARERQFVADHREMFRKSLAFKNAEAYIDGAKDNRRAALFARHGEIKVIHLVRDPRGYTNSYCKNHALRGQQRVEPADLWRRGQEEMVAFRRQFPHVRFLTVRYEELCRDFEAAWRRCLDFVGVEFAPPQPGQRDLHLLGNRMRWTFDGSITEDVSWREQLSPEHIAEVEARSGFSADDEFGYALDEALT